MIRISNYIEPTHDINAKITGFIETETLTLYEKTDQIPTMSEWIEPPLLMIEELDNRKTGIYDSTDGQEIILMKPKQAIKITIEQAEVIKKFFKKK